VSKLSFNNLGSVDAVFLQTGITITVEGGNNQPKKRGRNKRRRCALGKRLPLS